MKKMLVACLTAFAFIVPTAAVIPAASADTPNCVSAAEYREVQRGDSKRFVHFVFDVNGGRPYRDGEYLTKAYRGCRGGTVYATYRSVDDLPYRLVTKYRS